jgi:protein-tyrosine phosphatase
VRRAGAPAVNRPPFHVLHVCMGNICRSPMAERLLAHRVWERLGDAADKYVHSESAGTGGWHAGEAMNPPASRELRRRGAVDERFEARQLLGAHIDTADLILTATGEHLVVVAALRPDAADRAFVLGEFGRLIGDVDTTALPALRPGADAASVFGRGVALVHAVNAARGDSLPTHRDDLADPWGRPDPWFERAADQIDAALAPFVEMLLPPHVTLAA